MKIRFFNESQRKRYEIKADARIASIRKARENKRFFAFRVVSTNGEVILEIGISIIIVIGSNQPENYDVWISDKINSLSRNSRIEFKTNSDILQKLIADAKSIA